ncbi:hypothetical protein HELRODRAFT_87564, partial [Helobdella robusta]|uniref:cholesterol 7-desaturase n=1 Tax=Helobdella robusta TaxID=6412 RepID=T1G6S3_HELRO
MEKITRQMKVNKDWESAPPPYPSGWYGILESMCLRAGEIRNINCLGQSLVVYRGERDCVYVLDAFCSHLGGNMGVGGKVIHNGISCPYHGWLYSGEDGRCFQIPYGQSGSRIPMNACVKAYPTLEMNGFIYIWHHSNNRPPAWQPEAIDEVQLKKWTYRGRSEHYVNVHIQEFHEQGTDLYHLTQVYGPSMFAKSDLRFLSKWWLKFMFHDWHGAWSRDQERPHVGILKQTHKLLLFGGNYFPFMDFEAEAEQIGPGIVNMRFSSPSGSGVLVQSIVPIKNTIQRLVQHIYFDKSTPTFIAKLFLYHQSIRTERDIMIWNNKKYLNHPILIGTQADAGIKDLRRWYSQFYDD